MKPLSEVVIRFVRSSEDALDCKRWVSEQRIIAYDVETDGLNTWDGALRLVQFGSADEAWCIPFDRFPGLVRECLDILNERRCVLIAQNSSFDLTFLRRNTGWKPADWSLCHDTLLMGRLVEFDGSSAGLKEMATKYVDPVASVGQQVMKDDFKRGGWDWATVPVDLPSYWLYGGLDCVLTVRLFHYLHDKLTDYGMLGAYETEIGALKVIHEVEYKGLLLDVEHCHEQITAHRLTMDQAERLVAERYKIENIESTGQIANALLREGVALVSFTATGKPSTNAEALAEIAERTGHELPVTLSEFRRARKMISSYYQGFLDFRRSDGRVHPLYRTCAASTYRMSAVGPAMQTLPRPGTDPNVRNSFVAPEGSSFISADFSSVEARLFAHMTMTPELIDAFNNGHDAHLATARLIYRDDTLTKSDPRRQTAKNVTFASLYGAGPAQIARTAGLPTAEGEELFNMLHSALPGIKENAARMTNEAKANLRRTGTAYITLEDGRRLALARGSDKFYAFSNWLIQGTAAVLMKRALVDMDKAGLSQYAVGVIHDEVLAEVPDDEVEDYRHAIVEAMEDRESFAVPIEAECSPPAKRLGQCK